jgi:hypothetical protein
MPPKNILNHSFQVVNILMEEETREARKVPKRKFQDSWLGEDWAEDWLACNSLGEAFCTVCNLTFTNKKTNVNKHSLALFAMQRRREREASADVVEVVGEVAGGVLDLLKGSLREDKDKNKDKDKKKMLQVCMGLTLQHVHNACTSEFLNPPS